MQEFLVVDGYNIIGAWPELKQLKNTKLEEARELLIHKLSEYQSFSGMKVYVVFDAYQVSGLGKTYNQGRLTILYTKEKETADELIESLVTGLIGRRKQVYVATSDMIEQHVIFGAGALRLTASELRTKVRQNQEEIKGMIKSEKIYRRNTVSGSMDEKTLALLEQMRRGK
ncbi:NYN domain-containing protein [Paenibacillus sp. KN14-4R]|uniref:NYN domain-containing protein n=1 Tax=Paenibacillus sp. KN14-4R TaxID=3445773 RepID=UPI003FA08883